MATALTKPKLKSRVAIVLTRGKSKPTVKRKPARAIPVAKAEAKKVSGRTMKKKTGKNSSSTKIKNPAKVTRVVPGKSVKSPKGTVKSKVSHKAIQPVRKKPAVAKPVAKIARSQPEIIKHKSKSKPLQTPVKTLMPEITPTEPFVVEVEQVQVQVSPNLSDKALHDYKLVRNAIDHGDQKAFAELMSRYKDSIYFMLLKMVNNRDDAEDLTIEAFGKAFKNIRQYTPDYAFSTWLFKIATNNCIDFIRKKRKQAFSIDRGFENDEGQEMVLEVKSLHPDPEEHYMKKQKVEMMRDVVDKLKPRYKKLVELRYFRELAYEEIAVELNLPLGTVKAQLFRAREFLYQIMKNSAHHI